MYFKRKIDQDLNSWIRNESSSPALVIGIRQCGKTETIRNLAKSNNFNLLEINFWNNPAYIEDFSTSLDVDTIINNLSLRFPTFSLDQENTLIFFDEIQECPRARLALKNFKCDSRYKVIASGSYLGINGYIIGDETPAPIGYEEIYKMHTMDFEEFLWALGYKESQIDTLTDYFNKKEPIPNNMHNLFKDLFLKYVCIGGFPNVVKEYITTNKIVEAYSTLNSLIYSMQSDFGRRKDRFGNALFKQTEVSRIQNVFSLIPTFLSKENKRFIVSKINGGSSYDKNDAINYLKEAHIVSKVHNVSVPSLPLNVEKIESQFKLFPTDIGIVTSMYGIETLNSIYHGELGQGKGALYEAIVFDSLYKAGIEPYYFAKESGLEIDFVIAYNGFSTLIECKAKNGNTKSSKTVMKHPEHYSKTKLIKIGDYNISMENDIITIPTYLTFVLGKYKYDF